MSEPFFSSRWSEPVEAVTEAPDRMLPAGFRAGAVAAGLKPSGAPDLALLVSDAPATTSAARFTRSGVLAAPVLVCQDHARLDALRVVVANSGNANCSTGRPGLDAAIKMQGAAALAGRVDPAQVAVASTGVIGVQLDGDKVMRGLSRVAGELRPEGATDLAGAIMTTDAFPKLAFLDVELPGGSVRLSGSGQGRGDDPARLRDDAVLRADRRRARPRRPPTCCWACA